jgi:protein-S-isoprenylcysteine O-methyltransferase Ste14
MVNGTTRLDPLLRVERIVRLVLGAVVIAVLGGGIASMLRGLGRPAGRIGGRPYLLTTRGILAATVAFVSIGRALWRPLPGARTVTLRRVGLVIGSPLLAFGAGLYHVARRDLGTMHQTSTAFGVRLYADHRLVTTGVYGKVRHPMYGAVMVATIGALFLYRTWATVAALSLVVSVILRARREDAALEEAFGDEWGRYRDTVPGWLPRLAQRGSSETTATRRVPSR